MSRNRQRAPGRRRSASPRRSQRCERATGPSRHPRPAPFPSGQSPREGAPPAGDAPPSPVAQREEDAQRAALRHLLHATRGVLAIGPDGLLSIVHRDAAAAMRSGEDPSGHYARFLAALVLAPALLQEVAEDVCGAPLRGHAVEAIARHRRWAPTYAALRREEEAARARRRAERAQRVTGRPMGERSLYWHRYRTLRSCPDARRDLALSLGGRVVEGSSTARGVPCPACGRRSLWWYLAPRRQHRAHCNHGECAFSAPLHELEAGR